MTKWKIYNEDAVEWARNYQKAKFHALLCDAPYHLTSIVKRFGKKNSAPVKVDEFFNGNGQSKGSSPYKRTSQGFMGQTWDGGDLAFRPETWKAFGEVLHPGAFGMAFSASRNWHRMAVAIEDAGFILHPTIFLWAYGQGFPKATNISKQIDKDLGLERPQGKLITNGHGKHNLKIELRRKGDTGVGHWDGSKRTYNESLPASELAASWEGHRYGLQALKPAVEPIIVFQKPYEDKPLDNIVETGAGALNIDGARIPTQGENVIINRFTDGAKPWGNGAGHEYDTESTQQGRWPANLILTEESAKNLDAQTEGKIHGAGVSRAGGESMQKGDGGMFGVGNHNGNGVRFGDAGGASRFFYNVSTKLDESDPVYYCGKVSPKERNAGLDELEDKEFGNMMHNANNTGKVSKGFERFGASVVKNNHPTLKPIDLMRYLATLLLPPIEYAPRRIFIPFSGVASEMIGAGLAGWEHIVGVENDTENGYVDIAEKRLQHWLGTR